MCVLQTTHKFINLPSVVNIQCTELYQFNEDYYIKCSRSRERPAIIGAHQPVIRADIIGLRQSIMPIPITPSYKLFNGAPGGGAFNQQIDMMMSSCKSEGIGL